MGQFWATAFYNSTVVQDMHEVRLYIIQETLVVRDDYDRIICSAKFVYTTGDYAQSVDIKTRISLIEDCQFWLQHCHLENFIALFLTPGKTFVQTAAEVAFVHLQKGGFLAHFSEHLTRLHGLFTASFAAFIDGSFNEVAYTHPGDFYRILETQENTFVCTLFGI